MDEVKFVDDTSRGCDLIMDEVLFETDSICLCRSEDLIILFDKNTGEVLTSNLMFYYAKLKK